MTICNAQPTEAYVLIAGNAPGERIGLVVRGERGYNKLDFDNPTLDVNAVKALATIPSRDELIAQLLGVMQAPVSGFARLLAALAAKKEEGAPAEAA